MESQEKITLPEQKRTVVHRFEQAFHRNHRACDCALPMTLKKWNDALGTFQVLRLCCMARAVEALTGLDLCEVYDFPPAWEWDCAGLHQADRGDGTAELVERGTPPAWLLERMRKKGIEVRNLPGESE